MEIVPHEPFIPGLEPATFQSQVKRHLEPLGHRDPHPQRKGGPRWPSSSGWSKALPTELPGLLQPHIG